MPKKDCDYQDLLLVTLHLYKCQLKKKKLNSLSCWPWAYLICYTLYVSIFIAGGIADTYECLQNKEKIQEATDSDLLLECSDTVMLRTDNTGRG